MCNFPRRCHTPTTTDHAAALALQRCKSRALHGRSVHHCISIRSVWIIYNEWEFTPLDEAVRKHCCARWLLSHFWPRAGNSHSIFSRAVALIICRTVLKIACCTHWYFGFVTSLSSCFCQVDPNRTDCTTRDERLLAVHILRCSIVKGYLALVVNFVRNHYSFRSQALVLTGLA